MREPGGNLLANLLMAPEAQIDLHYLEVADIPERNSIAITARSPYVSMS